MGRISIITKTNQIMLNISKQIYAGWNLNTNSRYVLPEAEVIPFGESALEKKKLDAVTKKYSRIFEYDNNPLPGFTLYKADRKNYSAIDQTWLIIDPRGFLVRITSSNLESILHVTGITEGLIQEKCVWAREDSRTALSLIPISSPLYLKAIENTKILEEKVDINEVEIGDTVLLQNGLKGIFRGRLSLYAPMSYDGNNMVPTTYLRRQIVEVKDDTFFYQTDVKILKILEKSPLKISKEESADYLTKAASKPGSIFSSNGYFGGYFSAKNIIKVVSDKALTKVPVTLEEITKEEAKEIAINSSNYRDVGTLILENSHLDKFLIDYPYDFGNQKLFSVDSFPVHRCKVDKETGCITDISQSSSSIYNKSYKTSIDNFTKFYKIVKHVKNKTYV